MAGRDSDGPGMGAHEMARLRVGDARRQAPELDREAQEQRPLDLEAIEWRHRRGGCHCAVGRTCGLCLPGGPLECDVARLLAEVKRLRADITWRIHELQAAEIRRVREERDEVRRQARELEAELAVLAPIVAAAAEAGQTIPLVRGQLVQEGILDVVLPPKDNQVYVSRAMPEAIVLAARAWRDQEQGQERSDDDGGP